MKTGKLKILALCLVITLSALWLTLQLGRVQRAPLWEEKIAAAELMDRCMQQIREYQEDLGIPLTPEDLHQTGLLGPRYTEITTTLGPQEAKRTTADPQMAALVVELMREAGVSSGDCVGAAFSGSFPALNLAVLSACAAMEVDVVYIASVGASTYGATWPQLTFPEIAFRLVEDGLLPTQSAAYSLGGDGDLGLNMDPAAVADIQARMAHTQIPCIYEEDYESNVAKRMEIYDTQGPISCFIGVGGNQTTGGIGEDTLGWGVLTGLEREPAGPGSGLMQRYGAQGMPVIHLLNVKQLVADYGLPYDPVTPIPIGEGPLFLPIQYSKWPAACALLACALILFFGFHKQWVFGRKEV